MTFSEPVRSEGANAVASYRIEPDARITSARLSADGLQASLTLDRPLLPSPAYRLTVSGVQDLAPAPNTIQPVAVPLTVQQPVYVLPDAVCDGLTSQATPVPGLPVAPGDAWTVNFFVRTDHEPGNRTLIAGFGSEKAKKGGMRFLAKYANGIHFNGGAADADTATPLDVGKWQMLSVTYDGRQVAVYKNAELIGGQPVTLTAAEAKIALAPLDPWDNERRFVGEIRDFSIWRAALTPTDLQSLRPTSP